MIVRRRGTDNTSKDCIVQRWHSPGWVAGAARFSRINVDALPVNGIPDDLPTHVVDEDQPDNVDEGPLQDESRDISFQSGCYFFSLIFFLCISLRMRHKNRPDMCKKSQKINSKTKIFFGCLTTGHTLNCVG